MMKLIVIRHAEAWDRAEFAKHCRDDGLRPLTRRGQKRMKRAARGMKRVVSSIDVLASSPLLRAVETAEIIGHGYGMKAKRIRELAPAHRPGGLLRWLQSQPGDATVAIVGHEPHLGIVASWLLTGLDEPVLELKKGAACLLEFTDGVAAGKALLRWMMSCRQLEQIAGD